MTLVRTACPLDCPDACSMEVLVEGGRVEKIDGTRINPLTQGFICAKVRSFPKRVYGEHRLRRPQKRTGKKGSGRFAPVSWDEALDLVAAKIETVRQRWGGEAILPLSYGGSNGILSQDTSDARLFSRLAASRLQRTVCAAATGAAATALYGKMPGVALEDYGHASLIVVWGANPSVTGIHLVPVIEEARRNGSRLVVVDPRRTPLAAKADIHLQLRPGTDLPIALALIRHLADTGSVDHTFLDAHAVGWDQLRLKAQSWDLDAAAAVAGVPRDLLERFGHLYAETSPAVIRCGWGLERNRNGGSAVAAVLALPAVAGKFGVRGGGYTLSNSAAFSLRQDRASNAATPPTRSINMNRVGAALTSLGDPPIQLLFVYNNNPLITLPDQEKVRRGLAREDLFTVVFDQVHTDTARYADLLLPATTFLEHRDLAVGYGTMRMQRVRPAIEPVGEARPNYLVFQELCERLDLDLPEDPRTPDELEGALTSEAPLLLAQLEADGQAVPDAGSSPVQFVDVFPRTPARKVRLHPDWPETGSGKGSYQFRPDPATSSYPLALISPATSRTISSSLGELHRDQAALEMHPRDAEPRGLATGDHVRVTNGLGEVHCELRLSTHLRPGVVFLPKGLWQHNTLNGSTSNALVPDTLTDFGGGACFNDARVEVEKLPPSDQPDARSC